MSERSSELQMNTISGIEPRIEVQQLLRTIAGEVGYVQTRIYTAARKLGWPESRTKDLWYSDDRYRVDPQELERARHVARVENPPLMEPELARLENLERQVADLSALLATAIAGAPSASNAEAQRRHPVEGAGAGGSLEGSGVSGGAMAAAYGVLRALGPT